MNPLFDELNQDLSAIAVMAEWLGMDGVPVSQFKAEERANRCAYGYFGKPCKHNVERNWWNRVKHAVAQIMQKHLSIKNKMELKVSNESELGMCRVCGCCLPLKVWVPIKYVAEHTSQEQMDQFPMFCWQRNEILELKEPK